MEGMLSDISPLSTLSSPLFLPVTRLCKYLVPVSRFSTSEREVKEVGTMVCTVFDPILSREEAGRQVRQNEIVASRLRSALYSCRGE